MLYTNGKLLISSTNNAEELHKAVRKLTTYLYEEEGKEAEFKLDDSVKYPCYLLPQGIAFPVLDKVLRPHVALRAINEDIMTLPEPKEVEITYFFNPDETNQLGTDLKNLILRQTKVAGEKAAAMAEFTAVLKDIKKDLDEKANKLNDGHEERTYLCKVQLNFADGTKYYLDSTTGEVRDTAPLEAKDLQLRVDTIREEQYDPENPDGLPTDDEPAPAAPVQVTAFLDLSEGEQEAWITKVRADLPEDGQPDEEDALVLAAREYYHANGVKPFTDLLDTEKESWDKLAEKDFSDEDYDSNPGTWFARLDARATELYYEHRGALPAEAPAEPADYTEQTAPVGEQTPAEAPAPTTPPTSGKSSKKASTKSSSASKNSPI